MSYKKRIWQPTQPPSDHGELYHYGVIDMKWGVHKAKKYTSQNDRAAGDGRHIVVTYKDGRRAALDSRGNVCR